MKKWLDIISLLFKFLSVFISTQKPFELKSKDTSYPKHLFFGIVKILQAVKFHCLTIYLKKLKNTRLNLIRVNYGNFNLVYQSITAKKQRQFISHLKKQEFSCLVLINQIKFDLF